MSVLKVHFNRKTNTYEAVFLTFKIQIISIQKNQWEACIVYTSRSPIAQKVSATGGDHSKALANLLNAKGIAAKIGLSKNTSVSLRDLYPVTVIWDDKPAPVRQLAKASDRFAPLQAKAADALEGKKYKLEHIADTIAKHLKRREEVQAKTRQKIQQQQNLKTSSPSSSANFQDVPKKPKPKLKTGPIRVNFESVCTGNPDIPECDKSGECGFCRTGGRRDLFSG